MPAMHGSARCKCWILQSMIGGAMLLKQFLKERSVTAQTNDLLGKHEWV